MPPISLTDPRATLLLVDDESTNLQVLRHTLQNEYRLIFAKDGKTALELVRLDPPSLILLDIMMPGMSGYDVCKSLKSDPDVASIPVIFITALSESTNEQLGLELGAVDYISKPFNPHIVRARVRTQLSLVRTEELIATRLQVIRSLGVAAEYKDNETGQHVLRMSHYAQALALAVGYSPQAATELLHAAPMHDIGKIGIPDAILRKPGKLTDEEWVIMRQHTTIGARILGQHTSGILRMASTIALSHHEKWDGSGYPHGLAGDAIPHTARVVALVDMFDALTTERPYKHAWSVPETMKVVQEESGRHLDPELVEAFTDILPSILELREQWADTNTAQPSTEGYSLT